MRIIKLTNISNIPHQAVYINIEYIGYINEIPDRHTMVGVATNASYFQVKETAEEILKLIEASKGI
jgi:hypothetical protein